MREETVKQKEIEMCEKEFLLSYLPVICKSKKLNWIKYPCSADRSLYDDFFPKGTMIKHMVMKVQLNFLITSFTLLIRYEYVKDVLDKDVEGVFLDSFDERLHRIGVEVIDPNSETGLKLIKISSFTSDDKEDELYKLLKDLIIEVWKEAARCKVCGKTTRLQAMRSFLRILEVNKNFF